MISHIDQSTASNHHWCIIEVSSQIINFAARTRSVLGLSFSIVSDDASLISIGTVSVECAVLPPGYRRADIPLDAAFNIINSFDLTVTDNVFHIKDFPVPP